MKKNLMTKIMCLLCIYIPSFMGMFVVFTLKKKTIKQSQAILYLNGIHDNIL